MPLDKVGGEADFAIALLASRGAAIFLENALRSIAQSRIKMARVHVGIPASEVEELAPLVVKLGALVVRLDDLPDTLQAAKADDYLLFGTAPFNRFMTHKYALVRGLLREGRPVIYADVDVAWLRSPLEYLDQVLKRYPLAAQTEAVGIFPPPFCAGFMAFAPDARSIRLVDRFVEAIDESRAENHAVSDQKLLREIILQDPKLLGSIFPLPEGLFASGLLDRAVCLRGQKRHVMASALRPYIFHANWTIGLENKRLLLKEANAWFLADPRDEAENPELFGAIS